MPRLLAVFTFVGGVVLLFSGATPAAAGRLALLNRFLPAGRDRDLALHRQPRRRRAPAALAGAGEAARYGVLPHRRHPGDRHRRPRCSRAATIEEAALLAVLLLSSYACQTERSIARRRCFETRFSPAWIAAVAAAIAASVWLGLFRIQARRVLHDLWWQFELDCEAPRFLRASVGAATLVLFAAVARLIGPAPHEIDANRPTRICGRPPRSSRTQRATFPFLVYLRDKALLFNDDRKAFVMYAVQGRTWVALGDPVGPPDRVPGLIRAFLERCDDFGGTPVFYEVGRSICITTRTSA